MTEYYVGILVCNSQDVLDHKLHDGKKSESKYCYWTISRFPKRLLDLAMPESLGVVSEPAKAPGSNWYDDNDIDFPVDVDIRLYFAIKGQAVGYFICKAMGERDGKYELRFHSESWTTIKPIVIAPSQGFRYFNEGSS